jgi:DNA-binding CsgD family transcriptional regulator
MGSLENSEQRLANELTDLLATADAAQPALPEFLVGLQELLELDTAVAFAYQPEAQALSLDWMELVGPIPKKRGEHYTRILAAHCGRRPGLYDALSPEPSQQNEVVHFDTRQARGAERSRRNAALFKQLGIRNQSFDGSSRYLDWADQAVFRPMGFGRHHLRALICHGGTMLGWVGGCSEQAPTERQINLLQRLVPALRNRLLLEECMRSAPLYSVGLDVVMDELGNPAYLVNHRGEVRLANAQGKAELDLDEELRDRLRKMVEGTTGDVEFVTTKVVSPGLPEHYLVRQQSPSRCPLSLVRCAGRHWALTPRQSQVLALLAQGTTNKSIAAALGISLKTVEVHVSSILRKAGAANRSELVSMVAGLGTDS